MKTLLLHFRLLALPILIVCVSACYTGHPPPPPPPPGGVVITSPVNGSAISSLSVIGGKFSVISLSSLQVSLVRASDGKAWDGSSWGGSGSTNLAVTDSGGGDWQTAPGVVFPLTLSPGSYVINLRWRSAGFGVTSASSFSVGTTAPPVRTAPIAWGYNGNGQLGTGAGPDVNVPANVTTTGALQGKLVAAVAAGAEHTLALTTEGKVYAWGLNTYGQLGNNSTTASNVPVAVDMMGALAGKTVVSIGTGDYHSFAVTNDGRVYAWGEGAFGKLGTGNTATVSTPAAVVASGALAGQFVLAVDGGNDYSVARTLSGKLFSWGRNNNGQLGTGNNTDSSVPVAVAGLAGKTIVEISCGNYHTLALTSDLTVYAFGYGGFGCLGNGSTANSNLPVLAGAGPLTGVNIVQISASLVNSLALDDTGTIHVWGSNTYHGLGNGTPTSTVSSIPLTVGGVLAGKVVNRIGTGWFSNYAFTGDSEMFVWGDNPNGNLAGGTTIPIGANAAVPTEVNVSSVLGVSNAVVGFAGGWVHAVMLVAGGAAPFPQISVEAKGNVLSSGATFAMGSNAIGTSNTVQFTLRNRGLADLNSIAVSSTGGAFSFTAVPATQVVPGAAITFNVTFNPATLGTSTGSLQIQSSDPTVPVFSVPLTGTGVPMGDLDTAFANANIVGAVSAAAVQADHNIVIGGTLVSINGVPQPYLGRLLADGTRDTSFAPTLDGPVTCIALQTDGKIIIGGGFTSVNGQPRSRIARLLANGALDTGFNPNAADGLVNTIVVQPNGSILVGGTFSKLGSASPSFLARVSSGGVVDPAFNPVLSNQVRCLALQEDGWIVIGGNFTTINGHSHARMGRVDPDGFEDTAFVANISNGLVYSIVVLPDDRIMAAGDFDTVNGTPRNKIVRMNRNGVVDSTFDPNVSGAGAVVSMGRQADGGTILGGSFGTVSGTSRASLARIDKNGTLDPNFTTTTDGTVNGIALQDDGRILVVGSYATLGGTTRGSVGRLRAQNAIQTIDTSFPHQVLWITEGSFPETQEATLEASTDGGATWTSYGSGVRLSAPLVGWQWFQQIIPLQGLLRLRAVARSGVNNSSSTIIEKIFTQTPPAQIEVSYLGAPLLSGDTTSLGPVQVGRSSLLALTIKNVGSSPLTGLLGASVLGADNVHFTIGGITGDSLAPGATMPLYVSFNPNSPGDHTAYLTIPANDPYLGSFYQALTGTGGLPLETWRAQRFGDSANAGMGADLADPDGDGRSNIFEYATGSDPSVVNGAILSVLRSSTDFKVIYTRNKAALADLNFVIEWTESLGAPNWVTTGVSPENVILDNGTIQTVEVTVPLGAGGISFARLKLTPIVLQ